MFLKYCFLSLVILFALNIDAQELIDPASLPDVEAYTVVRTNPNADTIILALHGGPIEFLVEGTFTYLEGISTFSVVEVLKQEMLSEVLSNTSLTLEEGIAVNDTTVALIEKAVQFYKAQNKTVVLAGQSWGAVILQEYMDDYGVDNVHRIIPMEGRLNVQPEFVDYLLDGYLPTFQPDGYTIVLSTPQNYYEHGLLVLGAAAFANRWIDSLATLDLSKVLYTYGENDMQTGTFLPEEIAFLENTGARTLFIPFGQHGDSYNNQFQAIVVEFIREELVTDINAPFTTQESLSLFPSLAQNWIQIEADEKGTLHIYDMIGRSVYREQGLEFPLNVDVSNFENGQYIAVFEKANKGIAMAKFQVVK